MPVERITAQDLLHLSARPGDVLPGGRWLALTATEEPDRVLAVIAGDCDELIQDELLVHPAA